MVKNKLKSSNINAKEKIIATARNLFIKSNYNSVSMSDIAKTLKVSKAAIYYHFKSKEELYLEILSAIHYQFHEKLKKILDSELNIKEKFKKVMDLYLNIHCDQKKNLSSSLVLLQRLSKHNIKITDLIEKQRQQSFKIIGPFINQILKEQKNTKNLDPNLMFLLIAGSLNIFIINKMFFNNHKWTNEDAVNHLTTLVFKNN